MCGLCGDQFVYEKEKRLIHFDMVIFVSRQEIICGLTVHTLKPIATLNILQISKGPLPIAF